MKELDLMHGEAVSIGLVAAAACGVELDLLPAEMADRVASLLSSMGLPTEVPQPVPARDLAALMAMDKKTRGGELRVALPGVCGVELVDASQASSLARGIEAAWQAVGALA
jgi:3-dehydroquinate synthase